jgi:hypothetical protein
MIRYPIVLKRLSWQAEASHHGPVLRNGKSHLRLISGVVVVILFINGCPLPKGRVGNPAYGP